MPQKDSRTAPVLWWFARALPAALLALLPLRASNGWSDTNPPTCTKTAVSVALSELRDQLPGSDCRGGINNGVACTTDSECPGGGACSPGDTEIVGGEAQQCIDAIDAFNNGISSPGCHDRSLCNPSFPGLADIGNDAPPNPAGGVGVCRGARDNACTVIETNRPKSPGTEAQCTNGTRADDEACP